MFFKYTSVKNIFLKNKKYFKNNKYFRSMVAIVFQSVFYSEMHQNNIFLSLKLFLTSAHQNNKRIKKYN